MPDPSSGIEVLQAGEFIRSWLTDNAEIVKAKDSFYYRQWLLACSLYDTPFDFSARAKAFLK